MTHGMVKNRPMTCAEIEAIRQFYVRNVDTPQSQFRKGEFAKSLGRGTTTVQRYARIMGLTTRHRKPHSPGERLKPNRYTVDPSTGCWIWNLSTRVGYGRVANEGAHRYYYRRYKGAIPAGHHIDHLCRTPRCVNPDHLEAVTSAQNTRRGLKAKLSAQQVAEILKHRESGKSQATIARMYGVTPSAISLIVNKRRWK